MCILVKPQLLSVSGFGWILKGSKAGIHKMSLYGLSPKLYFASTPGVQKAASIGSYPSHKDALLHLNHCPQSGIEPLCGYTGVMMSGVSEIDKGSCLCRRKLTSVCLNNNDPLLQQSLVNGSFGGRDLSLYDFPLLQEAFENDLDDLKRHAVISSLPVFSRKVLKKKKAAMEDFIWKVATKSCSIAMIPVPGLSLVCDLNILIATMKFFYKVFGLDEDCLHRVAELVRKDYDVLKSAIKKSPMSSEITPTFVNSLLAKSVLCLTVRVTQCVLDCIPLLGYLTGGPSSFITTFHMLKSFLRDLVEDAENVRAKAAEP
uniref:Uncharacterized protein n=1 Tax=Sphaerodactylus townsendi TaxID=933632 RepID=A0ACB8FSL9_9SAUR